MVKGLNFLIFLILLASCMQEPKSDQAVISEAQPVQIIDEGVPYRIDTGKSIITWVGTKPTGRHNGLIKIKEGIISIIDSTLEDGTKTFRIGNAEIIIDMKKVEVLDLTDDPLQLEKLEDHLNSNDFFDTEMYPEARFEFISMKPIEDDTVEREENDYTVIDPSHIVNGNLTIKDVTLQVEFPAKMDYRNLRLEASAKFNIDRTDWDITYRNENDPVARARDGVIHNIVNVGFEIIARPPSDL